MESDVIALQSNTERPLWLDADRLKLKGQKREHLRGLIEFLESRKGETQDLAECLLGKRLSAEEPATSMRTLVAQIASENSKDFENSVLLILGRVVDQRNLSQTFQLPLPGIPVTMPKPVPPFTPARWGGLARYRDWSKEVLADIVRSVSVVDPSEGAPSDDSSRPCELELLIGRILASAVLWGGLLCRKYLEALFGFLSRWPENAEYVREHKRVYLVYFDDAGNCRRWIPDPITTLLITELKPQLLEQVAEFTARKSIDRSVLAYFEAIIPDPASRPRSLFDFIDSCLLYFQLRLPPCLTQYAAGKLPSPSPNPATWARMIGREVHVPASHQIQAPERELAQSEEDEEDEQGKAAWDQNDDWIADLRVMLGSGAPELTPSRALKAIKNRPPKPASPPEEELFLAFAADMLEERPGEKLRTVRNMVMALATRLPGVIDLEHPKAISPDEFAGAYTTILDDAISPNQHDKFRRYLRTWHHWLEQNRGAQKVDQAEVFGTASSTQAVDATLILEDEYLKARKSLLTSGMEFGNGPTAKDELRKIAGLILMLGHRCALRKYEVLKAPLDDVLLNYPEEFLVRPWSERRLKTPNAVRKLPLYALLDTDELELLRAWVNHRREQNRRTAKPSPFLFFSPVVKRAYIPEGRIFPFINEVLRSVTGDESVHFHTLRKSGTFLAFALLRPPSAPIPKWLDNWPEQRKRILSGTEWHKKLYANEFATRRHMFLIARTLGHSSPSVSSANYLELQGDLLSLWLEALPINLNRDQIETIAAVSERRATDIKKEGVRSALWFLISKRWKQFGFPEAASLKRIQSTSASPEVPQDSSIREQSRGRAPKELLEIERILIEVFEGANQEDLVWRSSYPQPFLDALLGAARSAAGLTVASKPRNKESNTSARVHSFLDAESSERMVRPTPLRAERDWAVFARFAANVFADTDTQKKREKFVAIANHWLESRRDERNGLEFSFDEKALANSYAKFLLRVGVAPEECTIRYFGSKQSAQEWKKSIPRKLWDRFEPARPKSSLKADAKSIGIKLLPVLADTSGDDDKSSSYGWRYLMLIVSLWAKAWHSAESGQSNSPEAAGSGAEAPINV